MTPEQFVFWLSGYLSDDNRDGKKTIENIKNALKEVKTEGVIKGFYMGTQE